MPIRAASGSRGGVYRATDRSLPFGQVPLPLRKRHHVLRAVLQRDELAAARQQYRIVELAVPTSMKPRDLINPVAFANLFPPSRILRERKANALRTSWRGA